MIFEEALSQRETKIENENLAITFHPMQDGALYWAVMNYSGSVQKTHLQLTKGYRIKEVVTGDTQEVLPYRAVLFLLKTSMPQTGKTLD